MINNNWNKFYQEAPATLENMAKIKTVACAFNTCIDSVIKIKGKEISALIKKEKLSLSQLTNIKSKSINSISDFIKGIFYCFQNGIAEEWTSDNPKMFDWMLSTLGTKKMQMGGQAGIVANTLSLTNIQKTIVHSNALSKLQAEQFLKKDNLLSFDNKGKIKPAFTINRDKSSSIHWIIEFDKNDTINIEKNFFVCPKSNRFIATYDPPLFDFKIDKHFLNYSTTSNIQYYFLSGFQALSYHNHGLKHINNSVNIIKQWKKNNPKSIIHLEIASTQDKIIRKAIAKKLIPIVDSIGMNERETIDILEVIGNTKIYNSCLKNPTVSNMFEGVLNIKQKLKCPRIQMHMYGIYITIQDKTFLVSPQKIRNGMILAATAAASKASIGHLETKEDILSACKTDINETSLKELEILSKYIKSDNLLKNGICSYKNFDIISIPAKIVEKPKTLVGMGDTISSFSIIGAC